jgi:predicted transcriptional regulator
MPTITELASEIVISHASNTSMTKEELIAELKDVYATLTALEKGEAIPVPVPVVEEEETVVPAISKRKAFGNKKIYCMVCGKGFTTLKRHLAAAHDMTPKEYRTQFDIPAGTTLAAKDYSESRRQMAIDKNLGAGLAAARAKRVKKK